MSAQGWTFERITRLMAGEARLVGEWSYALMTLRSRGKGNGRLSRQASWQMLELEIRLKVKVFCGI